MRIGAAVFVTGTVLFAACGQSGPAQSPPPSSSAAASGAPAPASGTPAPVAAAPSPAAGAPAPAAGSPEPPADKTAAPEPAKFHEVTIPVGTVLTVKLTTAIASDTSKAEDAVRGTLTKPITVAGTTAVPAGAEIVGSVLEAKQSGRVQGRAAIAFRFSRLTVGTETHQIRTAQIAREAAPDRKGDVTKGAIGGGVGGTGAVLATRGKEVRLPAGTVVSTRLEQALVVQVPVANR